LHRHTKRIGNGARHAGRNPGGIAIFRAARHQQEISHIDAGAQNAFWRQFRLDLIHHDFFPCHYCVSGAQELKAAKRCGVRQGGAALPMKRAPDASLDR
jgi:hypothetical protein